MTQPVMVLMKDHPVEASEAMAVSQDIELLMDAAILEDLTTNMRPLRVVGDSVEMSDGDELRIQETKLV